MKDLYSKRVVFTVLMIISLLTGVLFFFTNNFDFIVAATEQNKLHLPNIAYAISRTIAGVLLPLVFVVPEMFPYGRIKCTKILFVLYGIFMFLTTTWIFYFMADNSFSELFSSGKAAAYQSSGLNAFVSSYVFWDTYRLFANIFTVLYSALCVWCGICFDDNRKKVRISVIALLVMKWLFPLISNFIAGRFVWSSFWLVNNYLDLISFIAYSAALFVAASDDSVWVDIIWGQDSDGENPEDDEVYPGYPDI